MTVTSFLRFYLEKHKGIRVISGAGMRDICTGISVSADIFAPVYCYRRERHKFDVG